MEKKISFEGDSLFGNSINDSLGDITLKPNGGCLAIFHTYNDPYNPQYEHSIITRESSDCLNFQEPYVLQNWDLTGLTQEQLSHTGPSVFPWTSTSTSERYLMAYSKVPMCVNCFTPTCTNGSMVCWNKAQVQLGMIKKNIFAPPKPGPIKFIKLRLKDNLSFYDSNNDGVLDSPIVLPIDSSYESIINSMQPLAYEEYGNYRVKAYYAYCYYKNKKKIKCVVDDDLDIEGIGLDEDQNALYLKKGYFEKGDELEMQLILRSYDESKPKDKQKKCKKDDTCLNITIKFEQ